MAEPKACPVPLRPSFLATSLPPGVVLLRCGDVVIYWWPLAATAPPGFGAPELAAGLAPDEQAALSALRAPTRRDEYTRCRFLVRWLTGTAAPLLRTATGEPSWPPAYTGSITHKDGCVGLALAERGRVAGIGIDAEDTARVKSELAPRIVNGTEWTLLQQLARASGQSESYWLAVAFSFKEALFKSHFPLGQTMFYFHDAEITHVDPAAGTITASLHKTTSPLTPAGSRVHGHFLIRAEAAATFVLSSSVLASNG